MTEQEKDQALLAAWTVLRDPDASPEARDAAKVVVAESIRDKAERGHDFDGLDRKELAQEALKKTLSAQMRPQAARHPVEHVNQIHDYLWKVLGSVASKWRRHARRELPATNLECVEADPHPEPDPMIARDLRRVIEDFREVVLLPHARERRADRADALPRLFDELLGLQLGRRSVADIVTLPSTAPGYERALGAMYKRHSRFRAELHRAIVRQVAAGELSRGDGEIFKRLLKGLLRWGSAAKPTTPKRPDRAGDAPQPGRGGDALQHRGMDDEHGGERE